MILMYHKVHPDSPSMWWVTVNNFYRQMAELKNKDVVYLDDYDPLNKNQAVITFDGIYTNVLEYALPILKYFNYPFELFFTSDYLGLNNDFDTVEPKANFVGTKELMELVRQGGRLQWHTKSHINLKNVSDVNQIKDELTIPEELKLLDPNGFNWFAYPHGEFNDLVVQEVKKCFKGALSCNQGNSYDKFILNRITVLNKTSFRKNKIACIIPSYNYGAYLIEAIESVLRQTILPDEILISDDCSFDETQIIAEEYTKKYPNLISYNRNSTNLGIVKHFNKAIDLTTSEYIFFLGADNRLLSNYVEECSKILDSDENIAVAYTNYAFFGPRARLAYNVFPETRKGAIVENLYYNIDFPEFESVDDLKNSISKNNFIHGSSMFKRIAFKDVGGYMDSNKPEDHNLFRRIIDKGWYVKKAKKTNLEYRQHSNNQANNIQNIQQQMLFYKERYLSLNNRLKEYESSNVHKYSLILFKSIKFLKKNYKNPKYIIKVGLQKFRN